MSPKYTLPPEEKKDHPWWLLALTVLVVLALAYILCGGK